MKKIKVFLQSPWKFTDSPYYLYLRQNPPEGIEYMNAQNFNLIQNKKKLALMNLIKVNGKRLVNIFASFLPNAHLTKTNKEYDLIHCAHCLSRNKSPWICDTEWVGQFWIAGNYDKHPSKRFVKKYLHSKYCKKIVAWTEWSKKGIVENFPEIESKVELVYPAIPPKKFKKIKSDKIRLLFSSRRFYFKGGLYALEVIDKLTKKYDNVEGTIISDVPENIYKKYSKNKKIKFERLVPQEKLFNEIYPSTDIFVYPSFTDTFGFQITEAMVFGIPVVAAGGHSRRELIEEGKTGFVVDEPASFPKDYLENLDQKKVLNDLIEKTSEIIENKDLREQMSQNCIKLFQKDGKFSINKRNQAFKKIYESAII